MNTTDMHEADAGTVICTIDKIYRGCPKPDGWFGCFVTIPGSRNRFKFTGTTTIPLREGMEIQAVVLPDGDDGLSFKIQHFEPVTRSLSGGINYFMSFPGIGKVSATKIIAEYGSNAIKALTETPKEVKARCGLTEKQIKTLNEGVQQSTSLNKLHQLLPEFSTLMTANILTHFSERFKKVENLISKIRKDPYILCEVPRLSFAKVDATALRLGVLPDSDYRISKALEYFMDQTMDNNLYINLSDMKAWGKFFNDFKKLIQVEKYDRKDLSTFISRYVKQKESVIWVEKYNGEFHLYKRSLYRAMKHTLKVIDSLLDAEMCYTPNPEDVNEVLSDYEDRLKDETGISFSSEQESAIKTALASNISVITGGPGRGKTSVIDSICTIWQDARVGGENVILLAPTGKAVAKLKADTKNRFPAMTIDRYILSKLNSNKEELEADFIVVDECSMVGLEKISKLFSVAHNPKFCFVGDVDQLPPIEPGRFFGDVIASKKIPVSFLTIPFRNTGLIFENSNRINNHDSNLVFDGKEMTFIEDNSSDISVAQSAVETFVSKCRTTPLTQVALLSPVNNGEAGVTNLNITLQDIINKKSDMTLKDYEDSPLHLNGDGELLIADKGFEIQGARYGNKSRFTTFRIGDVVMNTENNYCLVKKTYRNNDYNLAETLETETGVFNGDTAMIVAYKPKHFDEASGRLSEILILKTTDNKFIEVNMTQNEFSSFVLGYAMTVHKSQGNEYKSVIYVAPHLLESGYYDSFNVKNLLYTAVTRAQQDLTIVGSRQAINNCIHNDLPGCNSNFLERLTNSAALDIDTSFNAEEKDDPYHFTAL